MKKICDNLIKDKKSLLNKMNIMQNENEIKVNYIKKKYNSYNIFALNYNINEKKEEIKNLHESLEIMKKEIKKLKEKKNYYKSKCKLFNEQTEIIKNNLTKEQIDKIEQEMKNKNNNEV